VACSEPGLRSGSILPCLQVEREERIHLLFPGTQGRHADVQALDQQFVVFTWLVAPVLLVPDHDRARARGGLSGVVTGRHTNKTARMISVHEGEKINAAALNTMLKQIIANNRAGGWRKLKAS
jgi:hypothetical protein